MKHCNPPRALSLRGRSATAVLLLALAGCSTRPEDVPWTKIGANKDERVAVYEACASEARQETQRNYAIDSDIAASRGTDWRNASVYNQQEATLTAGDAAQSSDLLDSCMRSHGYVPVR